MENKNELRSLTKNSQQLRKNMTKEERHLWYDFLKYLPITVNRQRKIGKYITDFYIACAKIVIELDGSQHYDPENKLADEKRDADLKQIGIKVLRFNNMEIHHNFNGVCMKILKELELRGIRLFADSCN